MGLVHLFATIAISAAVRRKDSFIEGNLSQGLTSPLAKADGASPKKAKSWDSPKNAKSWDSPKNAKSWHSPTIGERKKDAKTNSDDVLLKAVAAMWAMAFNEKPHWLPPYASGCLHGYNDVAYHNKLHAVDVFRFVLKMRHTSVLSKEEIQGIALAALCHDYGHPGLNNGFMGQYIRKEIRKYGHESVKVIVNSMDPALEAKASSTECKEGLCEKGTFIAYSEKAADTDLLPAGKIFEKGCERNGPGKCTSLLERHHLRHGLEILGKNLHAEPRLKSFVNVFEKSILHTDFGKDFALREELHQVISKTGSPTLNLHGLVLHAADINAASSEEFLYWACGVFAEFMHQKNLGSTAVPPAPKTVSDFLKGQGEWTVGIRTLVVNTLKVLKVPDKDAKPIIDRLRQNENKWFDCYRKVNDRSRTKPLRTLDFASKPGAKAIMEYLASETVNEAQKASCSGMELQRPKFGDSI